MLTVVSAKASEELEDGKIILHLLGDDKKEFQLAMTANAAFDTLWSMLFHLNDLPPNQLNHHPVGLAGSVSFGFDSQVKLVIQLNLNGLEIGITPPDSESEALATQLTRYLAQLKTRH